MCSFLSVLGYLARKWGIKDQTFAAKTAAKDLVDWLNTVWVVFASNFGYHRPNGRVLRLDSEKLAIFFILLFGNVVFISYRYRNCLTNEERTFLYLLQGCFDVTIVSG